MAGTYSDLSRAAVAGLAQNATLEAHESYLYQPLALLDSIQKVTFDQVRIENTRMETHVCCRESNSIENTCLLL